MLQRKSCRRQQSQVFYIFLNCNQHMAVEELFLFLAPSHYIHHFHYVIHVMIRSPVITRAENSSGITEEINDTTKCMVTHTLTMTMWWICRVWLWRHRFVPTDPNYQPVDLTSHPRVYLSNIQLWKYTWPIYKLNNSSCSSCVSVIERKQKERNFVLYWTRILSYTKMFFFCCRVQYNQFFFEVAIANHKYC